jgi:hypothetical protein
MSKGKSYRTAMAGAIFSVLFFGATSRGWAQNGGNGNGSGSSPGMGGGQSGSGTGLPTGPSGKGVPRRPTIDDSMGGDEIKRVDEQQSNSRNNDRQKKLQQDTEKLLALATQLKEEVDKTDKNTLSLEVIKKADEIEKLAKSVKDRMKG